VLLVVRHGITQWNADQRWQGWADIPLSDVGLRQVRVAARSLAFVLRDETRKVRLVSSDLMRAYQTAEAFQKELALGSIEVDEGLRERSVGDFSGKTTAEIERLWPGLLGKWRAGEVAELPNGEPEDGFNARISSSVERLGAEAEAADELTIAVSHGGVLHTLERLFGGGAAPVANVSGRWFCVVERNVVGGETLDLLGDDILDASGHNASIAHSGQDAEGGRRERTTGNVL
jgi:broad specificity phosphatase PhoE